MTDEQNNPVRSREEQIEKMVDIMQDYRLLHTKEKGNEPIGYQLIDALTYDGGTIDIGIEECGELAAELYDTVIASFILEAEARGATEQRRKDAEGQEPASWQAFCPHVRQWLDVGKDYVHHYRKMGQEVRPLYTHPANVAALEARVKELEEAIEDYFSARAGCEIECVSRTGEPEQRAKREARNDLRIAFERKISAALKREGGV